MLTMRRWLVLAVALLTFAIGTSRAKSATGDSVLVVIENDLDKKQFSQFFSGLEGASELLFLPYSTHLTVLRSERGFDLTFREPKAEKPSLTEDDVPQFSHVIFFTPTTKCTYICAFSVTISGRKLIVL